MFHSIKEAVEELKMGRPIIVVDDEDRENEGEFIVSAVILSARTTKSRS